MSDLAAYLGCGYKGDKKDGKYHGNGEYTFANGVKYIGEFDDGEVGATQFVNFCLAQTDE